MMNKVPQTPFATRLSGSAKETQLRIRSMFQWKKMRPPVWLFAFIVVVIFGCMGLVSCREKEDVLCMGLNARVVEIDTEQTILYIQDIDESAGVFGQRCALDCKQAAKEKKLIFVNYETSDLTDISFAEFQVGDELVISMLTSQKEGAKDASAMAEQVQLGTQRPLYVTLTQVANWYSEFIENIRGDFENEPYDGVRTFCSDDRTLVYEGTPENVAESLVAFQYYCQTFLNFDKLKDCMGSDTLRLSAENERENAAEGMYFKNVTIHNFATLTEEDFNPGGAYFADAETSFNFVDRANFLKERYTLTEYAIIYLDLSWKWSEKALSMGPQLDNGRYERLYLVGKTSEDTAWKIYECFWGERVLGRTFSEQDAINTLLMSELFTASNVSDIVPTPTGKLLVAPAAEGQSFAAAYFTERDNYELVIAVWDADTQSIIGTPFRAANSGGMPKVAAHDWEGETQLIYTANGISQGYSGGQAGRIRLTEGEIEWLWTVQGDIRDISRDPAGQPYQDYLDYWNEHYALMSPSGFDVFTRDWNYGVYDGSPQQWKDPSVENHFLDGQRLVDPDQEQIRAWLEEFCRAGNNATNFKNDSASWRILALERSGEHKKCTLLCVSEYDETAYLRAVLKMDHFRKEPLEVLDWEIGHAAPEELAAEAASYNRLSTKRDKLIKEYVQTEFPEYEVYFMEALDEEVESGKAAIKTIELLGRAPLDQETTAAAYRVIVKAPLASMNGGTQGEYTMGVVLTSDGAILGNLQNTEGMSVEEIIGSMRVQITPEGKPILTDYFRQWYDRVYFLGEEPGEPQEGDLRIDSVRYLGSEVTFETTGEAYLVRTSIYIEGIESADSQPVTKWWPVDQASYLVLGRGMDGELYEVRGDSLDAREDIKRLILEESYGVDDWEVTLRHDANPYPQPLALGWWNDMALSLVREEPTIERLEGWEPIHWEGDYWESYTLNGLSILRQYSTMANKNNYVVTTVELTRDDFSTPRGIKLGSTRDEVTTAYPELKSGDYWGKYPGEDYLWYCEDELDFGPALIFFFENDKVSKIILNNMFN